MDDFEKEIKQGFLEEATELLSGTEQCFLTLERDPSNKGEIEKLFRLAHNLKGSAKAVGFDELGAFTHELETFLLKFKNGTFELTAASVTVLLECNDHVNVMVAGLKENLEAKFDSTALIAKIQAYVPDASAAMVASTETPEAAPAAVEGPSAADIAAIEAAAHGGDVPAPVSNVVEMHPAPAAAAHTAPAEDKKPAAKGKPAAAPDEQIRVSLQRVEKLINYVGEMVILQTVLRAQPAVIENGFLRKTVHQLGKVTKEVQDLSMSLRMVPLKQTFQKMQRIVRDTSAALNKPVEIEIIGDHVEVDKTVLEQLGDPLVHLVRNAVDHGIENDQVKRVDAGKDPKGHIWLKAYHQSGFLVIEVKDDGGGLDAQKLRNKAIEKGIITASKVLSDKECHHLIFAPGFSTKTEVTEVSGRGVGMDVVRTNIESMQGEVEIHTELGKGTTFKVILPLTLAIIDGMIVRSDEDRFVIPISHVRESLRPPPGTVKSTKELGEILLLRGESLPLLRLSSLLGRKPKQPKNVDDMIAVVTSVGDRPFSVLVDDIIGQHEVVIKQLGDEIRGIRGFAGTAILGDGRPSLILELSELAKTRGVA